MKTPEKKQTSSKSNAKSNAVKRPRIVIFRSNKYLYAQVIDDATQKTLVSVHPKELEGKVKSLEAATALGKLLAQKAQQKGVTAVKFDRNGYRYHGKVKALADGAREGGLQF